jgi:hypothetical protein
MKNISLLLITVGLMVASCTNDGGSSKEDLNEAAIPNITKIATTDQGLNVVALKAGQPINLGLNVGIGFGDVASMDLVGIYTKGTVVEKAILKPNLTTFPSIVNISQTDLYNAFNVLNSANDVGLKDNLIISADLTLKNGTVIKMYNASGSVNFGAGIANFSGLKVLQNYIVSCPLTDASIFNGDYKVTADQWDDYGAGPVIPVVYNTVNGTKVFRIPNTTRPYIVNGSTSYLICTVDTATNTVTVTSNEPWNYGGGFITTVTGTGTVGSCTGDINLRLNFSGSSQNQAFNLVKQ